MAAQRTAVPVVLPVVDVTFDAHGHLTVTVDNTPYDVAANVTLTGRAALGQVLTEVTMELNCPVRVQVHEADGTTYTDILTPADRRPVSAAHKHQASGLHSVGTSFGPGLTMHGFDPGEQVVVSVIVTEGAADANGIARLRLPAALLAKHPGTVVLLGRTSGMVALTEHTDLIGASTGGAG